MHSHGRSLASAVGSEDPEELATTDRQRGVVHRERVAVANAKTHDRYDFGRGTGTVVRGGRIVAALQMQTNAAGRAERDTSRGRRGYRPVARAGASPPTTWGVGRVESRGSSRGRRAGSVAPVVSAEKVFASIIRL